MKRIMLFALILIIVGGATLRIIDVNKESLWTDEAFSLSHAQQPTIEKVITAVETREAAPPGYYILLHYWIQIFNNTETAIRSLSVVFSILSMILLFSITKEITKTKTALLATTLMSITMLETVYAQEARLYALFGFMSLLTTYFFIKIIKKNELKYYTGYTFAGIAALHVNYLAPFLFVLFTATLMWLDKHYNKTIIKRWIYAHAIIVVAALPLIPIVSKQILGRNAGLTSTLIVKGLPQTLAQLGLGFFALPMFALIIIVIVGLFFKNKLKNIRINDNAFITITVTAAALYLYASFVPLKPFPQPITHSYFAIRHSFFLMPIIYVYLAQRISVLNFKKSIYLITIIILINTAALTTYYTSPTKPQWQEAMSIIPVHSIILLDNGGGSNTFLLNYYSKNHTIVPLSQVTRIATDAMHMDTLSIITRNTNKFWLIEAKPKEKGFYPSQLPPATKKHELYGITVYHYTQ